MSDFEKAVDKIGDAIEHIFGGGGSVSKEQPTSSGQGKASALEAFGMKARAHHLIRNEWGKDIQYTRPLVEAEYLIQTEFKIK